MDNSHVALVSMMLKAESFSPFRCDRNIALGINLSSLMKVLRCAQNEDILTLKAEDAPDVVNLVFESSESDRLSEYDIKLMDIDQEHLGIPETEYSATISMPSSEFQRICRDLMALSESGTKPPALIWGDLCTDQARSCHRSYQGGCQIFVQRRHWQWSSHSTKPHQRREAGAERRHQFIGASCSHIFPQVPRQLLQSERSFQYSETVPLE